MELAKLFKDEFDKAFAAHDEGVITRQERDELFALAARRAFSELSDPETVDAETP